MNLFEANSGNNSLGFKNEAYDTLVNAAITTKDPAERLKVYTDAQRILVEDEAAIIPIYVAAQNLLIRPELSGVKFNAMGDAHFSDARWAK
ncbi:MAG: hypothetical protein R3E66_09025 [bacterium]